MFKNYWQAVKKPLWKTLKLTAISSVAVAGIAFFIQAFSVITGSVGIAEGLQNVLRAYGVSLSLQMALFSPWVFLYGGVKLFFQTLFPSDKSEVTVKEKSTEEEVKEEKKQVVVPSNDPVTLRKEQIQTSILQMLEENKDKLDIESIHVLERIHEDILNDTENYYQALDSEAKKEYEKEILTRFDELEAKVLEISESIQRQREHQMDKQLHIIDQITKK